MGTEFGGRSYAEKENDAGASGSEYINRYYVTVPSWEEEDEEIVDEERGLRGLVARMLSEGYRLSEIDVRCVRYKLVKYAMVTRVNLMKVI